MTACHTPATPNLPTRRPSAYSLGCDCADCPVVALAGNPNVGKSTLFNGLTGAHQHTGNWPGKTLEQKLGRFNAGGRAFDVVDLPGTYSLSAASLEEMVARDFLLREEPSILVAVVDASNLQRNLYLVMQLLELERPLLIALTMGDTAASRGHLVDAEALADALGVPVVAASARTHEGLEALRGALAGQTLARPAPIHFPAALEREVAGLEALVLAEPRLAPAFAVAAPPANPTPPSMAGDASPDADADPRAQSTPIPLHYTNGAGQGNGSGSGSGNGHAKGNGATPAPAGQAVPAHRSLLGSLPPRWIAIKLLEADQGLTLQLVAARCHNLLEAAAQARERLAANLGDEPESLLAAARYSVIEVATAAAVRPLPMRRRLFTTNNADRFLTHRWLGIPIFLASMWAVFALTANLSAPLVDGLGWFFAGPVAGAVTWLLGLVGLQESWVQSLLVDGVLGGVGGVLAFVPVLALLYLSITLLEDSGYMARAAFVMDRLMRAVGLHGKSFLPLLLGFGCTVPAIAATRTLEHERDRKLTAFLATFMSCGARLPVYTAFAAAFFGARSGTVIFGLYVAGIAAALLTGLAAKLLFHRREPPLPFVLELPPYRAPHLPSVTRAVWMRTSSFVRRAGTTIFATSVIVWLLLAIPLPGAGAAGASARFAAVAPEASLFGGLSSLIAPIFAPAGFGSWQAAGSLLTGLVAKEVLLGTIAQVYGGADMSLNAALQLAFSPAAALAFLVFVLLYSPCVSALAAHRMTFGARFAWLQFAYTMLVAWLSAVAVYLIAGWVWG